MIEVKICGLRSERDVDAAQGADYHGFVIETGTRRSLSVPEARSLIEMTTALPVAVTTSSNTETIFRLAAQLRPHAVQLNAAIEKSALTTLREQLPCEVWMAVHIGSVLPTIDREMLDMVDCVVLDTAHPDGGGSGQTHDHSMSALIARNVRCRVSLAGGLSPENVRDAIAAVRPDIVDVSSGVESEGVKDQEKIRSFVTKVRECQ